jgi:amino acid transporter
MTTSTPTAAQTAEASGGGSKGLRSGALGLVASVVIGVASTAPAYSLAASLGYISQDAGVKAPLIILLAFVPILFISYAYKSLNSRIPDCGTNFTWTSRTFGPHVGWLSGWGAVIAQVIVLANLAQIAGIYTFLLFNQDGVADSAGWVALAGSIWLLLMTYVAYRGIQVSARLQMVLLGIELVVLLLFAVLAIGKVIAGNGSDTSVSISADWFNPFSGLTTTGLSAGGLVAIFIYWGWDTAVSTNEETRDSSVTPGRSAVLSTILLLVTYLLVTLAAQSFAGVGDKGIGLTNPDNIDDPLSAIGNAVFGSTVGKILILAVLSSSAASAQTTILPAARSTLAMAVNKALPDRFAHVHRRFQTPSFSTWTIGFVSIVLFVVLSLVNSGKFLTDVIAALGFLIAWYYGLTGLASAWFFLHELGRSFKDLMLKGILPLLGGVILLAAMVRTAFDLYAPDSSETSLLGMSGAFVLGIGSLVLGVIIMVIWNIMRPAFFRKEVVPGSEVELPEGAPEPVL